MSRLNYSLHAIVFMLLSAVVFVRCAVETELYDTLRISTTATPSEIKRAYHKMSSQYHPDKNKEEGAAQKFIEISDAYKILSDKEKKEIYDNEGFDAVKSENANGGGGSDFFSSFFGGGGRSQQSRKAKGVDITIPLEVSLEDIFRGVILDVEISNQRVCKHCQGTGAESKADLKTCTKCQGRGVTVERYQIAPGMFQQVQRDCNVCHKTGKIISKTCSKCKGKKVVPTVQIHKLEIERGAADGSEIVLAHAGESKPGVHPGNVKYKLTTKPHPVYKRQGLGLYTTITVSLLEALAGFSRSLVHLDGSEFTVEQKEISQPGEVITVKGKGMPSDRSARRFGDLFVTIQIVLPKSLSAAKIKGISDLLKE